MFMSSPSKKATGTHWIEDRTGPTARLDALEKTEVPYPAGNKITGRRHAARTPLPTLTELPQLT